MPLLRHGTSTLSMINRRATQYQKLLNLNCVFLSITSTVLIFTAIILMRFYHIDKLDFWSEYFWIVPLYMIILGVYTLLVCVFGFCMTGYENRGAIAGFAVLVSIAFLAQLGSIFTALELRTTIKHETPSSSGLSNELREVSAEKCFLLCLLICSDMNVFDIMLPYAHLCKNVKKSHPLCAKFSLNFHRGIPPNFSENMPKTNL